jgi:hypothetical protein
MDARVSDANNWFSKLSKLLTHVHAGTLPSDALHSSDGSVDVDKCMTLWRKHQYTTAPTDGVTRCTYHAWFASDLPTDGSHWKPAPCITAPNIPYPHLINLIKHRTSNHKLAI